MRKKMKPLGSKNLLQSQDNLQDFVSSFSSINNQNLLELKVKQFREAHL